MMRPGSSNIAQEQCAKVFDGKVHSFWSEKKSKNVKIILICIFFFSKNCLLQIYFSKTVDQASYLQVFELLQQRKSTSLITRVDLHHDSIAFLLCMFGKAVFIQKKLPMLEHILYSIWTLYDF
jgi:hypothetical protein